MPLSHVRKTKNSTTGNKSRKSNSDSGQSLSGDNNGRGSQSGELQHSEGESLPVSPGGAESADAGRETASDAVVSGLKVGDRCYYGSPTNTAKIQELSSSGEEALLEFAHGHSLWIAIKHCEPLTDAHVKDPHLLKPGAIVKGEDLDGKQRAGKFIHLSMSGMAMIEDGGKRRLLIAETLMRQGEEMVSEAEGAIEEVEEKDRRKQIAVDKSLLQEWQKLTSSDLLDQDKVRGTFTWNNKEWVVTGNCGSGATGCTTIWATVVVPLEQWTNEATGQSRRRGRLIKHKKRYLVLTSEEVEFVSKRPKPLFPRCQNVRLKRGIPPIPEGSEVNILSHSRKHGDYRYQVTCAKGQVWAYESDLEELNDTSQQIDSLPFTFYPNFLTPEEADRLLAQSKEMVWNHNDFKIFGKTAPLPRLEAMYGDPGCSYTYRNVTLDPLAWNAPLTALRQKVEQATGYGYQVVIGNLYRNGADHIGWHCDDSPEMGESPAIASISLGATRRFSLRHKKTKQVHDFELGHGSLLVMHPGCQSDYVHRIVKTAKVSEERINWTFRPHIGGATSAETSSDDAMKFLMALAQSVFAAEEANKP